MKTSFLKNVRLFMFLLFAAFGSFVATAQTVQPGPIVTPIGGSKTPDTGGYINSHENKILLVQKELNIGGRDSNGGFLAIGGKSTGGGLGESHFGFSTTIGGRGTDSGTGSLSISTGFASNFDIGGRNSGGEISCGLISFNCESTSAIEEGNAYGSILISDSNTEAGSNGIVIGGKDRPEPILLAFEWCGGGAGQYPSKQPAEPFLFGIEAKTNTTREAVFPLLV
jgi:hypothetical protein